MRYFSSINLLLCKIRRENGYLNTNQYNITVGQCKYSPITSELPRGPFSDCEHFLRVFNSTSSMRLDIGSVCGSFESDTPRYRRQCVQSVRQIRACASLLNTLQFSVTYIYFTSMRGIIGPTRGRELREMRKEMRIFLFYLIVIS